MKRVYLCSIAGVSFGGYLFTILRSVVDNDHWGAWQLRKESIIDYNRMSSFCSIQREMYNTTESE